MFKSWEEMTDREKNEAIFWDLYKDVLGFRPRHVNLQAMTDEELKAELKKLDEELNRVLAEEKQRETEAIAKFEQLVELQVSVGARNRKTAIKWIIAASDCGGDMEYFCYLNGLPYGYFNKEAA